MLFSVIYSVDCPRDCDPTDWAPPGVRAIKWCFEVLRLKANTPLGVAIDKAEESADYSHLADTLRLAETWEETESTEESEYAYLEGEWEGGHHRKWCAVLSREQFDEFVSLCNLHMEDVETMGSIGAPGFGIGWAPAVSFDGDSYSDAIQNAYVTPIPEIDPNSERDQSRDWDRIRSAMLSVYA